MDKIFLPTQHYFYSCIEGDRLKHILRPQDQLTVDSYIDLRDTVRAKADNQKFKTERIVILP